MVEFTGERIVPESGKCEPTFALKMYQEHIARYLFASQVAGDKRILDIGCGVGYGAQFLARSGAAMVVAFDASEAAVAHAKQFYPHKLLRYSVGLAENFAFAEQFDVITCFELIEHVENPHLVVERISAALAPDGILLMSTPRKLRKQRSAFHRHEMAFHEFSGMLDCYFPHVQFYVENNHFASMVTQGSPGELKRIYAIHSQFDTGQADYFVAVASRRPLASLSAQIVLNDDSYVLNLEHDVDVLHRAEDEVREQNANLMSAHRELQDRLKAESDARTEMERRRGELEKELNFCREEVARLKLNEERSVERALQETERMRRDVEGCREELRLALAFSLSVQNALKEAEAKRDQALEEVESLRREASLLRDRAEQELAGWQALRQEGDNLRARAAEAESEAARIGEQSGRAIAETQGALRASEEGRTLALQEANHLLQKTLLLNDLTEQDAVLAQNLRDEHESLRTRASEAQSRANAAQEELARCRKLARESESEANREATRLTLKIAEMEANVRAADVDKTTSAVELSRLRQKQFDDRRRIAALQDELADIRRSLSWRITKPARRLLDFCLDARRIGYKMFRNGANPVSAPKAALPKSELDKPNFADDVPKPTGISAGSAGQDNELFQGRHQFDVIYVVGCHEGESKRYRVHNLVESIVELGYSAIAILDSEIRALVETGVNCRTMVLFRCAWDERIELALEYCQERHIPTVFDIDDFIFDPDKVDLVRVLSTFSEVEKEDYRSGVRRYRKTLLACDYGTCTTSYLARLLEDAGRPARVVPNSLNRYQLALSKTMPQMPSGDCTRIGYFSGSNTHQVDFGHCEEALLRIMSIYPEVRFVVAGILELGPKWELFLDRVERLPFMPYAEMLAKLAAIDINLAPLEPHNPYCESKSQLKIFEAGLVCVPTVATAVTSYCEAIDSGQDGILVEDSEQWFGALQTLLSSAARRKEMGRRAHERALSQFGPEVVGRIAIEAYGLSTRSGGQSKTSPADSAVRVGDSATRLLVPKDGFHISWIVPGLIIGGGGHRNILRAAYHLSQFGHRIALYFTNTELSEAELQTAVAEHFYPLRCPMFRYSGLIGPTDVIIATHWSTVDAAVRNRDMARELMYFVQDFEPAFAPMGTEYILAENTYRLGLYHITSGPWCENFLRKQFNAPADHFLFPVDTGVYKTRTRTNPDRNIVFFAKPEMPRRCYELGIMALEELHRLKPRLDIVLFGSPNVNPTHVPFKCKVRGILPTVQDLAEMYANADLGIVFSTTNPSLVPYEMMACGLPVVDLGRPGNEINYGGCNDIALLADPQPLVMARQIAELLDQPEELRMRSGKGLEFVRGFPSEEQMARRVETLIVERLAARGLLISTASA